MPGTRKADTNKESWMSKKKSPKAPTPKARPVKKELLPKVGHGPMSPPYLPVDVSDVEIAFATNGYDRLPPIAAVAKVDRRWIDFVEHWFFRGVAGAPDVIVIKEGIDARKAIRHLKSVMGTWDTKHEDKISGVAFLMQTWFDLRKA